MQELSINRLRFNLPQSWQEVPNHLILRISPLLHKDTPNHRIELVKVFMPRKVKKYFLLCSPEQVYAISQVLDWMWTSHFDYPVQEYFLSDSGRQFYLPAKCLETSVIVEFTYADTYFNKIVQGDSSKIDHLILSLCRPKRLDYDPESPDFDGDIREKFNPVLIENRRDDIKNLSLEFKMWFVLFFVGCKKSLAQRFPPLFKRKEEDEDEEPVISNTPDFGWYGVMLDLAETIVNEEKVQFTNLHNILGFLTKKHYDNLQLKAEQKKNGLS